VSTAAAIAARSFAAIALVLPWLAFLRPPASLLGQSGASICVALGALAGFGSAARFVVRRPETGLVASWALGLGSYLLIAGALTAAHQLTSSMQVALLIAGNVLCSLSLLVHRDHVVATITATLLRVRTIEVVIGTIVIAIMFIHVAGLASSHFAPIFDDDGNWYVAVKRLRDTGAFGDVIGYPRTHHLGGSVIASGLVVTIDEIRSSRLAEGIGFILLIAALVGIAFPRQADPSTRTRRLQGCFVFLLLVLGISGKAQAEIEWWAFWIPTFLVLASYRVLAAETPWTRARSIELGILLGALCTYRFEYVPFALVLLLVTLRDEQSRFIRERLVAGSAALLCVVLPLAIDRFAERGFATSATRLLVSSIPVVVLLTLAAWWDARGSRRPIVRFSWAIALGVALTYVGPALAKGYSTRMTWTLIYAFVFILVAELARAQWSSVRTIRFRHYASVICLLICLFSVIRAQDATVRMNWHYRFKKWFLSARYASAVPRVAAVEPYNLLLRELPEDAAVLSWVERPEVIDYAQRRVYDLRVPRLVNLRKFSWAPPGEPLMLFRAMTGARYLLLQTDRLREKRELKSDLYELWCWPGRPDSQNSPYFGRPVGCADPLEHEMLRHRIVRSIDNVHLIDLEQPSTNAL